MKKKIINMALVASVFMASCDKAPIESEQYKKLIYLVGAQDISKQVELDYSNQPVETFISVSSSGSLNIDKDVVVRLSNPETLIHAYNSKYFEPEDTDLFLKSIDPGLFEMPNKEKLTIKANEGIFARQPIFIKTESLHTDSVHAIPVVIEEVSEYEVNPKLKELILLVKLKNQFSGNYAMSGTRKALANNAVANLQKNKLLKATSVNQLRMYVGDVSETNPTKNSHTIKLTINADNSVAVTAWDELENVSGTGTYDPGRKQLDITYHYTLNGASFEVHEVLNYVN